MKDLNALTAPDAAELENMARAALQALPAEFAPLAADVAIRVAEFAPEEILDELQIDDPFELTGLYDGIPVTEKSVMDQPGGPDIVWLYRRPLLDEWVARGDVALGDLVGHVVTHELAHHFGWSDADIASIDRWWE
ncbi:Predicted Zn-dependent protease, minimal metalloprotease (MMP)-like domain [Paracoccus alcaliphilus]|uniref:Predicted Zn-dependent protease, minimal metalloprotease (MMP)-like domain n=1 Tax=Paracoccus alcaliphilus TaxID=34002 RepID=A0A1H8P1Z2_9RHOB|nr:metallopeptidase family protein [Paracoccus alcaliphilus]WCR17658.1 metallopeptidase family protein [Paracoccus alcaliphilus]SEO35794.1 Predicted Zn-dependent protease, minimal metalloprotease (MMP)-like domain [Paracoccus alcaliphilus]